MKTLRDILQSHHIMITTLTTYAHMCHYGRNLNILAKNYDALNAWRTKIDFSPLWLIPPILNFKKFRKSGWRLESGIGPWVCIYGQKNPTIIGHYVEISRHSGAMPIVRGFFWRSVSTRGLFNIELRLRHVLWSVGLSSYSRGLRGCWAEPVGRSRCVQQTLPPPHCGFKWLKYARNKFTWCDFTSFSKQFSADLHHFRFRFLYTSH